MSRRQGRPFRHSAEYALEETARKADADGRWCRNQNGPDLSAETSWSTIDRDRNGPAELVQRVVGPVHDLIERPAEPNAQTPPGAWQPAPYPGSPSKLDDSPDLLAVASGPAGTSDNWRPEEISI